MRELNKKLHGKSDQYLLYLHVYVGIYFSQRFMHRNWVKKMGAFTLMGRSFLCFFKKK